MANKTSYLKTTQHPWPCLLFLLPLLLAYELGVYYLGGAEARALRNGADAWLRWVLDTYGVKLFLAAPGIIVIVFGIWSMRRWYDRPESSWQLVFAMWLESILFAFGLWLFGHNFGPLLHSAGVTLAAGEMDSRTEMFAQVLTYVGAGIYEEILFRLFAITGLVALFRCAFVPNWASAILAGIGSALLFATAHHLGAAGEPMDSYRFVYRTIAGLYFAVLYWFRGFGVAVGTHALYDVLVGVKVG